MPNPAVQKKSVQWNSNLLAVVSLIGIIVLYVLSDNASGAFLQHPKLQLFKMLFLSIIIEALPFILIGVLVSAALQVFVSEQTIQRMIPKNPVLGIVTASVIGIIFPICECGMVPAIRRLIQKGMPLYAATTFILVGPILNPIVFWSTFTAFRNRPEMTISRMGLAFLVALVIGLIVYRFVKTDQLKHNEAEPRHHHHEHDGFHPPGRNKGIELMGHAISEFFEMGKYLMLGALLVGLLQAFVSKDSLVALGHVQGSANLLMMGLGFILSLCSTSDAFVAQSFAATFSTSSLVAFMVFGPMLNLKGILMMSAVFKPRFVALYSSLVFVFVYAGTLLLEWLQF
ncbi:permease [Paenibacillus tyrfis]|uniref:permease n=1 Tax=Paenibacillus tyrfis TaxID=1501230 RepID=UPI000B5913AB|nr:permease [Paenibacillus tyrfis]